MRGERADREWGGGGGGANRQKQPDDNPVIDKHGVNPWNRSNKQIEKFGTEKMSGKDRFRGRGREKHM